MGDPPKQEAAFVAAMEDVLDVYKRPYDPFHPVVAVDEEPVQLVADPRGPLPVRPGDTAKVDDEHKRNGSVNLFVAFEPLAGWRRYEVTDRRTRVDFAHFVSDLLDGRYRYATKVVLVMDSLNTHSTASLYAAFSPAEARRLADQLEIHRTTKHGSWLNVAEVELAALDKRLPDRLCDAATPARHAAAVEKDRNAAGKGCDWRFTTADARTKLAKLYPTIELKRSTKPAWQSSWRVRRAPLAGRQNGPREPATYFAGPAYCPAREVRRMGVSPMLGRRPGHGRDARATVWPIDVQRTSRAGH